MQTAVCNLTVEGLHTFAVGEVQALVHNYSGTTGPQDAPSKDLDPQVAPKRPDKIDELVAAAKPTQRDLAPIPDRASPQPKPTPTRAAPKYKTRTPGQSGNDAADNVPSWAQGERPLTGESGKDFAKRLLDDKYGPGNYKTNPGSEYNQIKKYGDRAFE